jgi:peptide/nickel transport system substrate-binding protein
VAPIDPLFTKDPKEIVVYEYSKRKASQLLDEAGWKLEKDGFRYKGGKKLSLVFMTTAGNKTRETVQTMLQTQWKAAGIEVVIKNEPARVFFGETTKERKYGAMAMYAWMSTPDTSAKSTLHSSSIATKANSYSGQNYTGWVNKKVDAALDAFDVEFNKDKRKKLTYEILKAYTDEVPVIPLYYRSDIAVIPANMQGYKLPGHQFYDTNVAENWNLEGSKLK